MSAVFTSFIPYSYPIPLESILVASSVESMYSIEKLLILTTVPLMLIPCRSSIAVSYFLIFNITLIIDITGQSGSIAGKVLENVSF